MKKLHQFNFFLSLNFVNNCHKLGLNCLNVVMIWLESLNNLINVYIVFFILLKSLLALELILRRLTLTLVIIWRILTHLLILIWLLDHLLIKDLLWRLLMLKSRILICHHRPLNSLENLIAFMKINLTLYEVWLLIFPFGRFARFFIRGNWRKSSINWLFFNLREFWLRDC